jgi:CHAT domain-containing protein/tetratricopeptide (TPR) repeat protein
MLDVANVSTESAAGRLRINRSASRVHVQPSWRIHGLLYALLIALFLLVPLKDTHSLNLQVEYERARHLFVQGYFENSQREADRGFRQFSTSSPEWAARFQLLEAESMLYRGLYDDALRLLASYHPASDSQEAMVRRLTIESTALARQQQVNLADQNLAHAEKICADLPFAACGDVLRARGIFLAKQGKLAEGRQFLLKALTFAQARHDRFQEAEAASNLGWAALQVDHFDEAVDWARIAHRISIEVGAEDIAEKSSGNLGWAYFSLGDGDRALQLFREAEVDAAKHGDIQSELGWISTAGYVFRNNGDLPRAAQYYSRALGLAKQINSKEDIVNSLEDLASISVEMGRLQEAELYIEQALPLIRASGSRPDSLDVMLTQGEVAAARRQDDQASTYFKIVERDPASQISMRLEAEHQLAKLYEVEGDNLAAERMYRTTLMTFESERAELKNEDSRLPFATTATRIYDDYIHFLVARGKTVEALAVADESRAQTLAQGLGLTDKQQSLRPELLRTGAVARPAGATILFYWLGERQSYLWAMAPGGTGSGAVRLFTLPSQGEIATLVDGYRRGLLNTMRTSESADGDGAALYRMLVAPAAEMIKPGGNVVVVCDGPLSLLNFETLVAPSPRPHYWIDDANVTSAPSLYMLASARAGLTRASRTTTPRLLLMGDAVSPNPDYPDLPMARAEMSRVEKHFEPAAETVYARQAATADAYLKSIAQPYSYIHFVTHGVASRTEPLDSAIILSRTSAAEDSFKLHARDIIQHPINAQLVTISACYGGGTRSYAGEGLVGLSWAFLRAGAHNVIGALWEASDDSTPQLMDALYQGVQEGLAPSAALRQAKLALLHSGGRFQQPFYWAPFQIYTGL